MADSSTHRPLPAVCMQPPGCSYPLNVCSYPHTDLCLCLGHFVWGTDLCQLCVHILCICVHTLSLVERKKLRNWTCLQGEPHAAPELPRTHCVELVCCTWPGALLFCGHAFQQHHIGARFDAGHLHVHGQQPFRPCGETALWAPRRRLPNRRQPPFCPQQYVQSEHTFRSCTSCVLLCSTRGLAFSL